MEMSKRNFLTVLMLLLTPVLIFAGEGDGDSVQYALNTLWVLLAAFLVFLMQAGFGMVEAGLTRAKNTVNILMKNTMDLGMASIAFFVFGYAIHLG